MDQELGYSPLKILVVGGGAAGFFAAIHAKETRPEADVILAEKSREVLSKVKISGGGRCNVTHACFDARTLSEYYPRGGKALIGPFQIFQPQDTMAWFESRGVDLKVESDNRVFPVSDSSQSIIDCLINAATELGVKLWMECGVQRIKKESFDHFEVTFDNGQVHTIDHIIITTGSSRNGYTLAKQLGHEIIDPIPSLFTVKINDSALTALLGLSVAQVSLKLNHTYSQIGPLLITHWGFSGPAVIKLSAWGARAFFESDYKLPLEINWLVTHSESDIRETLENLQKTSKKRAVGQSPFSEIPGRLWEYLCRKALGILGGITEGKAWNELSKKDISKLSDTLRRDLYQTDGKGVFKEEFVTCGGIPLQEVNFKTMESKICPGLYFAGEILDIDGITGGFNFQNAWTTGYLAGTAQ